MPTKPCDVANGFEKDGNEAGVRWVSRLTAPRGHSGYHHGAGRHTGNVDYKLNGVYCHSPIRPSARWTTTSINRSCALVFASPYLFPH